MPRRESVIVRLLSRFSIRCINGSDGSDGKGGVDGSGGVEIVESVVTSVGDDRLVDDSAAISEATSTKDKECISGEE
jgi:hypothetical protein